MKRNCPLSLCFWNVPLVGEGLQDPVERPVHDGTGFGRHATSPLGFEVCPRSRTGIGPSSPSCGFAGSNPAGGTPLSLLRHMVIPPILEFAWRAKLVRLPGGGQTTSGRLLYFRQ